jgi:hypothetical protein
LHRSPQPSWRCRLPTEPGLPLCCWPATYRRAGRGDKIA